MYTTGSFYNSRGLEIFYQSWFPERQMKALCFISHGYAEHGGKYAHVGEYLLKEGIGVTALDHQGHGRSQGIRADIKKFEFFLHDVDKLIEIIREEHPDVPFFLFGHSMGGGIAAVYATQHQEKLNGVILSGPAVKVGADVSPLLKRVSGFLSVVAPNLGVLPFEAEQISRDPKVVEAYKADPLVYHGKMKARLGYNLLRVESLFKEKAVYCRLPVLCMHGTADKLVEPASSQMVYDSVGSRDKTIHFWEGLYHELVNEPEQEQVLQMVLEWIKERM